MGLNMNLSKLAVLFIIVAGVAFVARSGSNDNAATDAAKLAAAVPASAIKTITSNSCASDGCPVSCEAGDTMLSAFCVSGTKARFADTLKLSKGTPTASCGMGAENVILYCGH
jgi:drug/metabolite transporter (DMT)-like permease